MESYRVDQNHPQAVAKARRRKIMKANLGRISRRHIRVILEYAAGKDLAEIAREEKSSRGTILPNFKNGSVQTAWMSLTLEESAQTL